MTSSSRAKAAPSRWKGLGVRIASALVLIPCVVAAVVAANVFFLLLMAVGATLLALEWGVISEPRASVRTGTAVMLGVLAAVFAGYLGNFPEALLLLTFGAAGAALYARILKTSAWDAAYGVFYIGWPCVVLIWLRKSPDGMAWTILLFSIAWTADISAYLIGNLLKGPKFWPRFSPNKTWSGFLGGLGMGVFAAFLFTVIAPFLVSIFPVMRGLDGGITAPVAMTVGLIAGLATMAGDLWESMLKRRFGVKDAGNLIPGHGGLLDRVDGMMFAVVAVAAAHKAISYWGLA
jgi:phosphatidate cytidylyltransferase